MAKKLISYKILYYLSLLPFLGFFTAWLGSWVNIYRRTNNGKYVFFHFILWIFPMCIAGGIVAISIMIFMVNLTPFMYKICGLLVSYIACLIMSISCIGISKGVINKFETKIVK